MDMEFALKVPMIIMAWTGAVSFVFFTIGILLSGINNLRKEFRNRF